MKILSRIALVAAVAVPVLAACTKSADSTVAVTGVTLNETVLAFTVGEDAVKTLTATVTPDNASNKNVSWSIDDANVASITPNGASCTVAAGVEGTATITVTTEDGSKKATCEVTVSSSEVHVTFVSIDVEEVSLEVGGTAQLTATVYPENATDKTVYWSSDDDEIATVNENGVVTGVAPGKVAVTVLTADGGKTATCSVKVGGFAKLQLDSAMFASNAFMTYVSWGQDCDKYGFGNPNWFNPLYYEGESYRVERLNELGLMANMWDDNEETCWHTNLDWGSQGTWPDPRAEVNFGQHYLTLNLPENYTKVEFKLTATTNQTNSSGPKPFGSYNNDTGEYEGGFVLYWSNDGEEFVKYDNGDDIINGKVECPGFGAKADVTMTANENMPSIAAFKIENQKASDWTFTESAFGIAELEVYVE